MEQSILIFGAGDNQLTLIRAAKELRIKSIVIDPNPEAPGKVEADIFQVVAPNDYVKTKEIATEFKVNGIVTSQMENPLKLMAKLAHELNYNFPSIDAIECCRNKSLMKKAFINANVPCAKGMKVSADKNIIESDIKDYNFPLIIKPLDSHSSRGVIRVENFLELKKY